MCRIQYFQGVKCEGWFRKNNNNKSLRGSYEPSQENGHKSNLNPISAKSPIITDTIISEHLKFQSINLLSQYVAILNIKDIICFYIHVYMFLYSCLYVLIFMFIFMFVDDQTCTQQTCPIRLVYTIVCTIYLTTPYYITLQYI